MSLLITARRGNRDFAKSLGKMYKAGSEVLDFSFGVFLFTWKSIDKIACQCLCRPLRENTSKLKSDIFKNIHSSAVSK